MCFEEMRRGSSFQTGFRMRDGTLFKYVGGGEEAPAASQPAPACL